MVHKSPQVWAHHFLQQSRQSPFAPADLFLEEEGQMDWKLHLSSVCPPLTSCTLPSSGLFQFPTGKMLVRFRQKTHVSERDGPS